MIERKFPGFSEGARYMSERYKEIHPLVKMASGLTILSLAGCAVAEKLGWIDVFPDGQQHPSPTETVPPTEQSSIDIDSIPVTQESFGGSLLTGEIIDVNPTDAATDTLKNKILAEFQESSFNPHSDLLANPTIYGVNVLGSNLIDQDGNKQPFFFVRPFAKDGKPTTFDITDQSGAIYPSPFLFYVESDGKQFVPGGTGKEELGGRFLPVASYEDGELRYFGLVSSVSDGNINLNLFMTYNSKTGITFYTDPYSRQTISWQDEPNKPLNDVSSPKLASLISYRFIPESTPTPEAPPLPQEFLDKLPAGYRVTNGQLLNESSVALGTIKAGQSGEGYSLAFSAPDVSGTLQKFEVDLSAFVTHPSGALLIDRGERVGFVWKGDKWAEILLDIKFETDGRKLNEFPPITYEDIASGRLAEAERLTAQPFPEGVEPLNNYYYQSNLDIIYPNLDSQTGYEFSRHLEKFPMRFVYFYQAEINKIPVVIATLQVLNKDNASVFIHMVESRKFINSYRDSWNESIQLRRVPIFGMALGGDEYDICNTGAWSDAPKQVVCPLNAPQKERLQIAIQRLIEEQRIPEEFEQVLFLLESGRWY